MAFSTRSAKTTASVEGRELRRLAPRRRRARASRLTAALALLWLSGCLSHPEPQHPPESHRESVHRLHVLDGTGQRVGSLTLRRRGIAVADARGIPLGRARSVRDRVEVCDRQGKVRLVLRPAAERGGSGRDAVEALLEDGAGRSLGRLTLTHQRLALYDSVGQERGEVVEAEGSGSGAALTVSGPPGVGPIWQVRPQGLHHVTFLDEVGSPVRQVVGADLPLWAAAVLGLEPPEGAATEAGGSTPADAERERAWFHAGTVLYLLRHATWLRP